MESIIERNALQPVDHVRGAPRWPFRPGVYVEIIQNIMQNLWNL